MGGAGSHPGGNSTVKRRRWGGTVASAISWYDLVVGSGKSWGITVTPTETSVHGDALCFMVMGPSLLQKLAVGGW